jgi:hypothetical protein
MYATCIHCQRALGRNELLETLPIGRRIAFDEANGRIWVVCHGCSRWNLVPFDSRYEAIETSERLYRESRLRMSTGQIGLAKTRERTELVRIGAPLRPEMAAWRYAGSMAKRRMRYAMTTGPMILGSTGVIKALTGFAPLFGLGTLATLAGITGAGLVLRRINLARLATLDLRGDEVSVNRVLVKRIRVDASDPDSLQLLVPDILSQQEAFRRSLAGFHPRRIGRGLKRMMDTEWIDEEEEADRQSTYRSVTGDLSSVLRVIMPIANEAGAPDAVITDATNLLSYYDPKIRDMLFGRRKDWSKVKRLTLTNVSEPRRLALETLVHEESERRWLAGELKALEAEWVRADEIATIADGLIRDPTIEAALMEARESRRADD